MQADQTYFKLIEIPKRMSHMLYLTLVRRYSLRHLSYSFFKKKIQPMAERGFNQISALLSNNLCIYIFSHMPKVVDIGVNTIFGMHMAIYVSI